MPSLVLSAQKGRKAAPPPAPGQKIQGINDVNLPDFFRAGEEQLKKGKPDEALRLFQAVHAYTRDALLLMQCVKGPYEKALNDQAVNQNQREDLYLKLQRISNLTTRYAVLKADSAYNIGVALTKKGDSEQARKYLLEACQTAPFSLNPKSTWAKSKDLLLGLFRLEGEF